MTRRMFSTVVLGCCAAGCAAHRAVQDPVAQPGVAALSQDRFQRDQSGAVSEEALHAIFDLPVDLDGSQRVGILTVTDAYRPDRAVPVPGVPVELARALESAGLFASVSEVAGDWPADGDVAGLRELAARYRSPYLLLYRQRFVDDEYSNGWAFLYATVIGAFVVPGQTMETSGVLEATLFDVRTGTIVFTVFERVAARSDETPCNGAHKLRALKARLVDEAGGRFAEKVVSKARHLIAASRERRSPGRMSADSSRVTG